jgi:DNA-binding transcriptional LysR family regulator
MAAINHFNLRSFDLNLLVAFDAMMRDRNVTKAAARLKIQQPAMSHNLATLRMLLADDLFVRVGHVMQPTAKAQALSEQVSLVLQQTQAILRGTNTFDPATADCTFRIGFSCEELLVLPELSAGLEQVGPGLKIVAQRVVADHVGSALDEGTVDLAIGCYAPELARYRSVHLFEQRLVCCYKAEHFNGSAPLTLPRYLAARHAVVSQRDGVQGCLGSQLAAAGYEVNAVVAVPDYLTALAAVAAGPLVLTLPSPIARRYAAMFGLAIGPAPVVLDLPSVTMTWSTSTEGDPSLEWLRQQVLETVKQLDLADARCG